MQGMTFNLNALAEDMSFPVKRLHMNRYCYLFGQPAAPRLSESHFSGIDILGVKFKSMGMYRLTGLNMQHLADDIVEAESLWGNEVELLCDPIYESSGTGEMIWILYKFPCNKILQQRKRENNLALQTTWEIATTT